MLIYEWDILCVRVDNNARGASGVTTTVRYNMRNDTRFSNETFIVYLFHSETSAAARASIDKDFSEYLRLGRRYAFD